MHLTRHLGYRRGLDSVRFVYVDGLFPQLNLHPLYVAFGESIQISRDPPPGHEMTFPQALKMVSCGFVSLLAVPAWVPKPFVPESAKRVREAVREFKVSCCLVHAQPDVNSLHRHI
jgi:hypothetical protein